MIHKCKPILPDNKLALAHGFYNQPFISMVYGDSMTFHERSFSKFYTHLIMIDAKIYTQLNIQLSTLNIPIFLALC